MEEDIEYLQQLIGIEKEYKYKPIKIKTSENTAQAIRNLIARYKELEEENKKMKANNLLKLNKEINENIQVAYGGRRYNTEGIVIENYIPKSKVKEKIEELGEEIKYFQKMDFISETAKRIQQREVLQELIED